MPPSAPLETAVVVLVDSPALDAIYRETYPVMAEQGVPLHVTLVYPFAPPEELPAALPRLGAVVAGHKPFAFELTELRTFPEYVWIAPEPAAPFRALTSSIESAFPDHPHWMGEFAEVIPHATLAHVGEGGLGDSLARLRAARRPASPRAAGRRGGDRPRRRRTVVGDRATSAAWLTCPKRPPAGLRVPGEGLERSRPLAGTADFKLGRESR